LTLLAKREITIGSELSVCFLLLLILGRFEWDKNAHEERSKRKKLEAQGAHSNE
jgi:hypothetical protein